MLCAEISPNLHFEYTVMAKFLTLLDFDLGQSENINENVEEPRRPMLRKSLDEYFKLAKKPEFSIHKVKISKCNCLNFEIKISFCSKRK